MSITLATNQEHPPHVTHATDGATYAADVLDTLRAELDAALTRLSGDTAVPAKTKLNAMRHLIRMEVNLRRTSDDLRK